MRTTSSGEHSVPWAARSRERWCHSESLSSQTLPHHPGTAGYHPTSRFPAACKAHPTPAPSTMADSVVPPTHRQPFTRSTLTQHRYLSLHPAPGVRQARNHWFGIGRNQRSTSAEYGRPAPRAP